VGELKGPKKLVTAEQWPPKDVEYRSLYLRPRRTLSSEPEPMGPSTPRRTASTRRR
jgi:uncharacterized protein